MPGLQTGPLSFVVRIWVEQTAEEVKGGMWRGHITCLPEQEQRYVQDLDEIAAFIGQRIEAMGLQP